MAWQDNMTLIVRHLVADVDSTKYSNSRIQQTIVIAASIMLTKVDFDTSYTIDVNNITISPDPEDDVDFVRLVTLQASYILVNSEAKTAAVQAYRITDGPSTIDSTASYKSLVEMAKLFDDELKTAILAYQAGNSVGAQAIMTPYTVAFIDSRTPDIRNY